MQPTAIYLQENFIFLCTFVILTWADDKNCLENVLKFDGFYCPEKAVFITGHVCTTLHCFYCLKKSIAQCSAVRR